jgi:hypothetical protein
VVSTADCCHQLLMFPVEVLGLYKLFVLIRFGSGGEKILRRLIGITVLFMRGLQINKQEAIEF